MTKVFKRVFFLPAQEEIQSIYSPTFRCFIFFATTQPTTGKQPGSLFQALPGKCSLTRTTEARTANSGFKKLAVLWLNQVLVSNQTLVQVDNFVLRNRQLLKPANR